VFSGGVVTDNTRWDITQLLDVPHDGTFAVVAETSDPTRRRLDMSAHSTRYTWTGLATSAYQLALSWNGGASAA
jgi:hypothetical protein